MNVLDENVRDDQRVLLRQWRIPVRQIGRELSHFGIQDHDLIPFLLTLKRPTLFTQDGGFFRRERCHRSYCLVWLDVGDIEVAAFIRRLLRHPTFRTHAQRLGKVIHVRRGGVRFYQTGQHEVLAVGWGET